MKFGTLIARAGLAATVLIGQNGWQPLTMARASNLSSPDSLMASAAQGAAAPSSGVAAQKLPTQTYELTQHVRPRDIDSHIHQLSSRIETELQDGRITQAQSEDFRAATARIAEQLAQYRADRHGLSEAETERLHRQLDIVSKALVLGSQDRQAVTENLGDREDEINQRILLAFEEKRLSESERDSLLAALKNLFDFQNNLKTRGVVTLGDLLAIALSTDLVELKLARMSGDRPLPVGDLKSLKAEVQDKLAAAAPKLDADSQSEFKAELERLSKAADGINAQPAWKQLDEKAACAIDLGRLKTRLDDRLNPAPDNLSERLKEVDQQILSGLKSGRLTTSEGHQLIAELSGIADEAQAASAALSGAALSTKQKERLNLEVERLSGRVAQTKHESHYQWGGIAAFRAHLDNRIAEALTAKRLSEADAKLLKEEIDKVVAEVEAATGESASQAGSKPEPAAHELSLNAATACELGIKLESLVRLMNEKLQDRAFSDLNLTDRLNSVDSMIAAGIESGRLTPDTSYYEKLAEIRQAATSLGGEPSTATARAKLCLAGDLEKLVAAIQRQLHGYATVASSLNDRESWITNAIADAVSTGRLDVADGLELRNQLDVIQSDAARARSGKSGLSAEDAVKIGKQLSKLADSVDHKIVMSAMMADQIDALHLDVSEQLGRAFASGRLSLGVANKIEAALDKVSMIEHRARATEGGLSLGEGLKLRFDLERINSRLESELTDKPLTASAVDKEMSAQESRLAALLCAGRLSLADAREFKHRLDNIAHLSADFRESGGSLSIPETVALNQQLHEVSQQIAQAVDAAHGTSDINTRQAQLDARVKQAQAAGKISSAESRSLLASLDHLAQDEAAFRVSGEVVSYTEAVTLVQELERASSQLDELCNRQVSLQVSGGKGSRRTK